MASPLRQQQAAPGGGAMAGPSSSAQRVLVRHAGGTIKLPLLPGDIVKSLRHQLQLFGLRPCESTSMAQCVQLRDEQTMAQADILDGSRVVFMAKDPPAAAGAAAASSNAGERATGDGWSLWVHYRPRPLEIFVKLLTGRTIPLTVRASESIEVVKQQIAQREGFPPDQQLLFFGGQTLKEGRTLADYGVSTGWTIQLSLRLRGNGHPALTGVVITCSDNPPRIGSYFTVAVPRNQARCFDFQRAAEKVKVTCDGVAVPGKCKARVDESHVRFKFRPNRALNPMKPGSQVEVTCLAHKNHDILPNVPQFALLPLDPIALRVCYVEREGQSLVKLVGSSADLMAELRQLIAADARVSVTDVVSIHCGLVELTDRYDVDELVNGDALIVRLRTPPRAPQSAGLAAAAPLSGHKRGADGSAASGADGGEAESAFKRSKNAVNK